MGHTTGAAGYPAEAVERGGIKSSARDCTPSATNESENLVDSNYSTVTELHRQAEADAAQLQARDAAEWFAAAMDEADAQGNLAARRERQVCYLRTTIRMQSYIIQQQRAKMADLQRLLIAAEDAAVMAYEAATHAGIVSGALRALLLELPGCFRGEMPDGEHDRYESQRIWGLAGVLRKAEESEAKS